VGDDEELLGSFWQNTHSNVSVAGCNKIDGMAIR
jgi:hypothetical protein